MEMPEKCDKCGGYATDHYGDGRGTCFTSNNERLASRAMPAEARADGVGLIAAERERQKSVEGWTDKHDDAHDDGDLASAAVCYAAPRKREAMLFAFWPWDEDWFKPTDRMRDLVKAGALIAAEIDRMLRKGRPGLGIATGGEEEDHGKG